MEEEVGGASGSEEVVQLQDAVELLVEHLMEPVLPLGQVDQEEARSLETQEAVARQVRKLVLDPYIAPFGGVPGGEGRSGHGFGSRGGGTPRRHCVRACGGSALRKGAWRLHTS